MNHSVAIETAALGKRYDGVTAIDDLSFQVGRGEIFGLLGPNGAGKSTTLRILITVLKPTSGTARVLGHDVVQEADRVRHMIGYVPQERAVDRFLTGREHLELLGNLYHLPRHTASQRIKDVLALVDLEGQADRVVKTYSGGMKRKLDIACGLLADPDVLFLDEPTLGLDVQSRLRIWDYIRLLRDRGITVVLTTNYLDEADQLCDRLAIIDEGRIKVLGSPKDLKAGLGGDILMLTVPQADVEKLDPLSTATTMLPFVRAVHKKDQGLEIRVENPEKALPAVLEETTRLGCGLELIEYHRPRLDDVFIAYTGHAMREESPRADA